MHTQTHAQGLESMWPSHPLLRFWCRGTPLSSLFFYLSLAMSLRSGGLGSILDARSSCETNDKKQEIHSGLCAAQFSSLSRSVSLASVFPQHAIQFLADRWAAASLALAGPLTPLTACQSKTGFHSDLPPFLHTVCIVMIVQTDCNIRPCV